MGREIRRVPPNWEHPQKEEYSLLRGRSEKGYSPLYDQSSEDAWAKWRRGFEKWVNSEHDRVIQEYGAEDYPKDQPYAAFCLWNGEPPNPELCRPPWKEEERTWWQVYETVSEGTPVTPPFATQDELIEYLVANGDFWDQQRRAKGNSVMNCAPWPREQAEKFVCGPGWAPSMVIDSKGVRSGVEALTEANE